MKKQFSALKPGERFKLNGRIYEKIEPLITPKRGMLRGNFRNVKTGILCRGNLTTVEIVG